MNDENTKLDTSASPPQKRLSGRQRTKNAAAATAPKRTRAQKVTHGPTETAVRAEIAGLRKAGHDPSESLAQMAYHLARKLDDDAGLATAAVARELRATLAALTPEKADDDGDPIADLIAALSTPVDDAAH